MGSAKLVPPASSAARFAAELADARVPSSPADFPECRARDRNQHEALNLADLPGNVAGRRCRTHVPPGVCRAGSSFYPDTSGPKGRWIPGPPQGVVETEISAQTFSKHRVVRNIAHMPHAGVTMHRCRMDKLTPDLVLDVHGQHRSAGETKCSASLVGHGECWFQQEVQFLAVTRSPRASSSRCSPTRRSWSPAWVQFEDFALGHDADPAAHAGDHGRVVHTADVRLLQPNRECGAHRRRRDAPPRRSRCDREPCNTV